jgi:N-acetylglucosamine-6-sulfatase
MRWLVSVVLLSAGCGGSSTPSAPTPSPTPTPGPPPNIVFILTDDLDVQSMPHMPKTLALLAGQGVTFSNSFVTTSLCAPSRASILTGQYGHNNAVRANFGPLGGYDKFHSEGRESATIATWLKAAGYHTVFVGKYLNGYPAGNPAHVPQGWDDWHADYSGDDGHETGLEYYDYAMSDNGKVTQYGHDPKDYLTDVVSRKALDALAQIPSTQPFFLYVAPRAPHEPALRAQRHNGMFDGLSAPRTPSYNEGDMTGKPDWLREFPPFTSDVERQIDQLYRDRLGTLQAVDEMVEKIVQALAADGRLANTYIMFGSDNGFILGPHRFPHGKIAPYEESIRVPLIVRGPGIPAGQTIDALVFNVDYAPTFVAWARASAPDLDGRSFAALLETGSTSGWRSDFLLEHWRDGNNTPTTIPDFFGVRTTDYSYVEYKGGQVELYDIHKDPYQLSNLYFNAPPGLVKQLSDRVAALKPCQGAACRN